MKWLSQVPASVLVPGMLGLYALAFIAGGVYYLEQRVGRIRDHFPHRAPLAVITGYAALGIGILAAISLGGYLAHLGHDFALGAMVAALAGVGFWICHLHLGFTPLDRVRDGALAFICAGIVVLTAWWLKTL